MIAVLNAAAALLGLAALFGFLNYRFLKLPQPIGLVIIALLASLAVIGLDAAIPGRGRVADVQAAVIELHFSEALMQGMLSFLLFAGALHVDLGALAARKWAIGTMASIGVLISTALVGFGIWGVFSLLGISIPLIFCLVFGALISPTDPVAVLGILKTAKIPKNLEAKIAGESLFNDGIGVVVFIILAAIALGGGHGGEALGAGGTAISVSGVQPIIAHSRGAVPADQLLRQVHELIDAARGVVADLAAFLRLVLRSRAVLILPRPLAVAQAPRAGRNQVGATSHIHIHSEYIFA